MQTLLAFLRSRPVVTGIEIQAATHTTSVSRDVDELRKNGFDIDCDYFGMSEAGRKIYNYQLMGEYEKSFG